MAALEPFASEASSASAHLPVGPAQAGWRLLDRLVVIGFVLGLLVPGLVMATGRRPAAIENRPLVTAPALTVAGLVDGSWSRQMDAFFNDNIVFRPRAVRIRAELEWASGGTGTPAVVRGRDGWLFLGAAFTPPCHFTVDEQLRALGRLVTAFEDGGQELYLLAVPDKQSVYPEQVVIGPRPGSCVEQGREPFRTGLVALGGHVIDGWSALAAARDAAAAWSPETSLYFLKDSHWTPAGATAAIKTLIQAIDPTTWADSDVTRSGTTVYAMDLARLMGLVRRETVTRVVMRPSMALVHADVPVPAGVGHAYPITRVTASGDRPLIRGRTLVIYDSFFARSIDLVAPFFSDTTWLRIDDLIDHPELAAELGRFDRVILERAERGLFGIDYEAELGPYVR